jgi:hypothetical protein
MSDGTGSLTYSYDTLSRLQSETKQFIGPGAPSGNFTLAYDYNFANQVKSVTDQRSGTSFSNNYDNIGRVTLDAIMGGVGFAGPVGAGVSTTYFVVDMTVGWPAVGRVVFSCDANCQYRANHYGMFAK